MDKNVTVKVAEQINDLSDAVVDLSDVELAFVGGGSGEVSPY
jgi:hypothetical protein